LTSRGPFPPSLVGAKAKDKTETALNTAVCTGVVTAPLSLDGAAEEGCS
jgi:hypothetical protein